MPTFRSPGNAPAEQAITAYATKATPTTSGAFSIRYVCRNTFEVTNGWRVPAALYWRTDNRMAEGFLEVPANGRATLDAGARARSRNVQLFTDAARTQWVASARNANASCNESATGDAGQFLTFASACGNTYTIANASPRRVRVSWQVPNRAQGGLLSIPARWAPGVPMVLSFDVAGAPSVHAMFGALDLGTQPAPSNVSCREGALLSWQSLGASSIGGAAFHSTYAEPLHAIFVSNGPDYGPGHVWRIDLTNDQLTELPSLNYPFGKYRQLVFDEANNRLVTYWDGLGQAYSLPVAGGSWAPVGTSGNSDAYYEGAAFWNPVDGRVSFWGGYGLGRFRDTFWSLDPTTGSWSSVAPAGLAPWPRIVPLVAVDRSANRLFLTSGEGSSNGAQFDPTQQFLGDLWSLDLATHQWTNIIPVGAPPVYGGPIAYVPAERALYRFGGYSGGVLTDALFRVDLSASTPTFEPITVYGARPFPRYGNGFYYDAQKARLVLVSGNDGVGYLNDLWQLQLP
jgi:hypothetical protein